MEDELIDFSGREDEFLDPELKQRALAFAIVTSVVGFVLSAWLFLGQKLGPASVILDRKAAEGRSVSRTTRSKTSADFSSRSFRAPQISKLDKLERRFVKPSKKMKSIESLEDLESKRSANRSEKRVVETSLGVVPDYQQSSKPSQAKSKRSRPKKTDSLDRLLYPLTPDRPDSTSLGAVEMTVAGNVFVMANLQGEYQVGLGLDSSGRALVSDAHATPEYLSRIWVDGSLHRATIVGRDPRLGLALIQLEKKSFHEIPLAPSPPSRGERILAFYTSGRQAMPVECRAGLSFGKAGFFVGGGLSERTYGAPLLNDRGELIGCHVNSLPEAPGSGIHLASDTAAIYRLVRGYQGSGSIGGTQAEAVDALAGYLAGREHQGETKRGRVLPGVGLSDFHLGMKSDTTERWLSAPVKTRVASGLELWKSPAPPVTLYFANQRLALVASDYTGFATPDGLAPGVSVELGRLASEYPDIDYSGGNALTPGLDVMISQGKVQEFVVKPELDK